MASYVQNLLNNVLNDGARSTKFECIINLPTAVKKEEDILALVKTSQYPGKSHDTIDLKYKGRSIPIKGQVKYDNTWSCTFYLEQDHKLKKIFENWIESLDQNHNMYKVGADVKSIQATYEKSYVQNLKIVQLDFDGSQEVVVYELHNCFPKSVSAVNTDYSAVGEILEFSVEFSYSHYTVDTEKANNGSFIEQLKNRTVDNIEKYINDNKEKLTKEFKNFVTSSDIFKSVKSKLNSIVSTISEDEMY